MFAHAPATNAVSERSASALRRVKTYLRATISQLRLNNLLVLHAHKEKTDSLDISACLNYFIEGNEHRIKILGGLMNIGSKFWGDSNNFFFISQVVSVGFLVNI